MKFLVERPKFTFDDIVRVKADAPEELRPGSRGSVIMVFGERERFGLAYFDQFAPGNVYSIEYEDGVAKDVHESSLEPWAD
jgi:hypothetical protein